MSEKQQRHDPWQDVQPHYYVGQLVTGSITRVAPFGAFASLEEGMEGLIPRAELPAWMNPFQHLHEGLQLPLRILEFDPERHHLKLSLTQASQ
jgi:small subunit ribosomal protein S1